MTFAARPGATFRRTEGKLNFLADSCGGLGKLRREAAISDQVKSRAVIYGIEAPKGLIYAIAVTNPLSRSTMSFVGADICHAGDKLAEYDAVVGISIDKLLSQIGLSPAQRQSGV